MKLHQILALTLLPLFQTSLYGAETVTNSAFMAFPAVQEGASARAIALGSTYVGIAEGSASLLWNPAGLGNMIGPEIALHHNASLVGAYQDVVVFGLPLGRHSGLGVSLNFSDKGSFEGRDAAGTVTSNYNDRAYGASVGWGYQTSAGLSLGLGLKFNQEDIADRSLKAVAGDLGLLFELGQRTKLGATYTNLGPSVDGRNLAQGLRLGASSYLWDERDFQCLLALSGESLMQSENSLHAGLELNLYQTLQLRAGYAFNVPNPLEADGLRGVTLGLGFNIQDNFAIDYSFVPLAQVGSMQRLSLTYTFSHPRS